jgi:hypothetical protein
VHARTHTIYQHTRTEVNTHAHALQGGLHFERRECTAVMTYRATTSSTSALLRYFLPGQLGERQGAASTAHGFLPRNSELPRRHQPGASPTPGEGAHCAINEMSLVVSLTTRTRCCVGPSVWSTALQKPKCILSGWDGRPVGLIQLCAFGLPPSTTSGHRTGAQPCCALARLTSSGLCTRLPRR